jgi:hypothetical protein
LPHMRKSRRRCGRRMVGDHYEVKVDGEWMPVPNDKINNVVALDGGAHVCAPRHVGSNKGVLFSFFLPRVEHGRRQLSTS